MSSFGNHHIILDWFCPELLGYHYLFSVSFCKLFQMQILKIFLFDGLRTASLWHCQRNFKAIHELLFKKLLGSMSDETKMQKCINPIWTPTHWQMKYKPQIYGKILHIFLAQNIKIRRYQYHSKNSVLVVHIYK